MSIDLDDVESRINDGIYGDDRMSDTQRDDAFAALAEIIAEVERLRGEVDLLRTGREAARSYADRVEAKVVALRGERAAVVAFLTGENDARCRFISDHVAMRIERGEHRREETE